MQAPSLTVNRPPAASLREHVTRTLTLAVPVMLARTGILLLVVVDTAMVGRHDTRELAFYALSTAPQMPMLLFGIGMMMGTMVLSAQAIGAGEPARSGAVRRVSLGIAATLGGVFAVACQGGHLLLDLLGQDPELADGAASVLAIFGLGMPAMLMFTATSFFLEAAGRPSAGMLVMLAANLLNALGNWVFISGNLGMPALGADGAAAVTTAVRWLMLLALVGYAFLRLDRERFGLTGPIHDARRLARRLRSFGLPMGLAHALESAAFACLTLFAGWIGVHDVAAFQIAMNLLATVFMSAIGIAAAASIRVGNAVGRGDGAVIRVAGWVATAIAAAFLLLAAALIALWPGAFATLYTSDAGVMAIVVPTLLLGAVAVVPDGLQGVLMGSLRGVGDVWPATALYLLAFWGVMVPVGYVAGVQMGLGAPALMASVAAGATLATALFAHRFWRVSGRLGAG